MKKKSPRNRGKKKKKNGGNGWKKNWRPTIDRSGRRRRMRMRREIPDVGRRDAVAFQYGDACHLRSRLIPSPQINNNNNNTTKTKRKRHPIQSESKKKVPFCVSKRQQNGAVDRATWFDRRPCSLEKSKTINDENSITMLLSIMESVINYIAWFIMEPPP